MLRALDRLDNRYAGWLRVRPELGFLAIGLLFVAATAVHAVRYEAVPQEAAQPAAVPTEGDPGGAGSGSAQLVGPSPEDDPDTYAERRYAELAALAEQDPDLVVPAIVSFDDYATPAQAAALLADSDARVYAARYRLRAAERTEAAAVSDFTRGQVGVLDDLEGAVVPALQREAQQAREHAAELAEMAATTDDPEFSDAFLADRNELLAAAAAAGPDCRCVYAVLVEGSYADLAEIAARAGVRLVDPAPPGSDPATVIFLALPPDS